MTDSTDRDDDAPESNEPEREAESKKPATAAKPRTKAKATRDVAAKAPLKRAGIAPGSAGVLALVALALGGAGGWFGHIAQAKAAVARADAAPAGSAGSHEGPCGAWETKICSSSGQESAPCQQAQMAVDLLTPSGCQAALDAVPATLAKIKAARSSCETLVKKLCADLTPESPACAMVKERTPSFPPKRCDEMLGQYDAVLGELRQLEAQGGLPIGSPQGAAPGTPMPSMPADDGHGH